MFSWSISFSGMVRLPLALQPSSYMSIFLVGTRFADSWTKCFHPGNELLCQTFVSSLMCLHHLCSSLSFSHNHGASCPYFRKYPYSFSKHYFCSCFLQPFGLVSFVRHTLFAVIRYYDVFSPMKMAILHFSSTQVSLTHFNLSSLCSMILRYSGRVLKMHCAFMRHCWFPASSIVRIVVNRMVYRVSCLPQRRCWVSGFDRVILQLNTFIINCIALVKLIIKGGLSCNLVRHFHHHELPVFLRLKLF